MLQLKKVETITFARETKLQYICELLIQASLVKLVQLAKSDKISALADRSVGTH